MTNSAKQLGTFSENISMNPTGQNLNNSNIEDQFSYYQQNFEALNQKMMEKNKQAL